jgi:hypothetical protein
MCPFVGERRMLPISHTVSDARPHQALRQSPRKYRLCGRERDFPGTDFTAKTPLQLVLPFLLIPRLGPVVEWGGVVAAEAYRPPVVVFVLSDLRLDLCEFAQPVPVCSLLQRRRRSGPLIK